jgi:preprotein translocase subunit SecB
MADETPTEPTAGNGSGNGADTQPHAAALLQYIKDLSVESPNSPQCFQWQTQPQVDVQFTINADKIAEDVHEVVLKITVAARSEPGAHFIVELSYAGLFGIRNFPDEAMAPFVLVEAPRMLFPFARQIIADAVQNAGFPPLLLEPIDFGSAFMQQLEAAQAGGGEDQGSGELAPAGETTPTEQ